VTGRGGKLVSKMLAKFWEKSWVDLGAGGRRWVGLLQGVSWGYNVAVRSQKRETASPNSEGLSG
jgi:hypothetical protein